MSRMILEAQLDGTIMERSVLYCQEGYIIRIVHQGYHTKRKKVLCPEKPISETLYIQGIKKKLIEMFGDKIEIKTKKKISKIKNKKYA